MLKLITGGQSFADQVQAKGGQDGGKAIKGTSSRQPKQTIIHANYSYKDF
jgi:hypothetical protein